MFLPVLLRVEACLSGEMAANYVTHLGYNSLHWYSVLEVNLLDLTRHVATSPGIADNDQLSNKVN